MYDPRRGDDTLLVRPFHLDGESCEPARTNRFSVYRPGSGSGSVAFVASRHAFGPRRLIVLDGFLPCLPPRLPQAAAVGSLLIFVMSFVTLSFLITTPECWAPDLGDPRDGFPYLSGAGRLVLKDAIMMGAALVTMADSAKAYLPWRGEAVA